MYKQNGEIFHLIYDAKANCKLHCALAKLQMAPERSKSEPQPAVQTLLQLEPIAESQQVPAVAVIATEQIPLTPENPK